MNKEEAIAVMESKTPVRLRYATGDGTHARGVVISYTDAPTVVILTPDGRRVSWRADLTEAEEPVTDCPHIATVTEPRPGEADAIEPVEYQIPVSDQLAEDLLLAEAIRSNAADDQEDE